MSYNAQQFSDVTNSILPSKDALIDLIPSYMVFDFSARYKLNQQFQFEAGVNNIFNEKYFTRRATAYPGPGILPSVGRNIYIFNFAMSI